MSGETAGGFFPPLFFSPLVCARFYTCFCSFAARSSARSTNKPPATYCCVGFQSQAKGQSISLRTKKKHSACLYTLLAGQLFRELQLEGARKLVVQGKQISVFFSYLALPGLLSAIQRKRVHCMLAIFLPTYKFESTKIMTLAHRLFRFFVALSAKFQSFTFRKSQKTRPV